MVDSWRKLFESLGKKREKDPRRSEKLLHGKHVVVESILQKDPHNPIVLHSLMNARDSLRNFQDYKVQGAKVRAKINLLENGDRGSKFFFQLLKYKEAREKIDMIMERNSTISTQGDILKDFSNYYAQLFTT